MQPDSDLSSALGRLGYGAANLGNLAAQVSDEECWEVLDCAWENGIRYFDTAPHYGLGLSERRLGAFLRTKPRDEYILSTKVGRRLRVSRDQIAKSDLDNGFDVYSDLERVWDPKPAGIRASVDASLERLGLDRIDVLYVHDPEQGDLRSSLETALPALVDLRRAGAVAAVGVGSMSTEALLAAANTGMVDLLMVAGRYTLAEQAGVQELSDVCERHGVGIVTASVFNSGVLATARPARDARYDYGAVPQDVFDRITRITGVCEQFGVELPAAALQYTLRNPVVRCVVVGTAQASQLAENVERMAAPIPEALWERLRVDGYIP